MAKIKEFIKPTYGIFSNMPQDIWEGELDSTFLDVELFTRLSNAEMSPLALYYYEQNDLKSLSELLYQRYNHNWKRIWDALREEYDIKITTTMNSTTERESTGGNLETRALIDKTKENVTGSQDVDSTSVDVGTVTNENSLTTDNSTNATLTKTGTNSTVESTAGSNTLYTDTEEEGTLKKTGTNSTVENTVDSNTLKTATDVEGTLTKTGTEATVDVGNNRTINTYDELNKTKSDTTKEGQEINKNKGVAVNDGSNILTKSGMEKRSGSNNNTKDLTDTETGTIGNHDTLKRTGSGTTKHEEMFNGMGGQDPVPSSSTTDTETPNYLDTNTKAETRNLTNKTTGTDNTSITDDLSFEGRVDDTKNKSTEYTDHTDALSFVGRKDSTEGTDKHTGTVENNTTTANNSTNKRNLLDTDVSHTTENQTGTHAVHGSKVDTLNLSDKDERHTTESQSGTHAVDSSKVDTLNLSDKDVRVATETQTGTGRDVSNLSNTVQGTTKNTSISDISTEQAGTVAVDENGHFIETQSMEGSTPLRTFQALINEELEGRTGQAWNFTNIIIEDVQTMITRKVWKKRSIWDE